MAKHPETLIVEKCIEWIKNQGGDAFHVHGSALQREGEPDLCGEFPKPDGTWIHFKIEAKVLGQSATPLQKVRLDRYARKGYTVGVIHSLDELKELITNASNQQTT